MTSNELELSKLPVPESIISRPWLGGEQHIFRFNNGYGASVVRNLLGSYGGEKGLWELAMIEFHGNEYKLVYDTGIIDDVEGWLSPEQVGEYLVKISNYKENANG